MHKKFGSEPLSEIRQRLQARTLGSTIVMIVVMLALPIILSACGKAEWREVKAPVALPAALPEVVAPAATVEPAADPAVSAPVAATEVPPSQTPATAAEPTVRPAPRPVKPRVVFTQPVPVAAIPKKAPVVRIEPVTVVPTIAALTPAPATSKKSVPGANKISIIDEADRYILIQNIATEKLRVYERSSFVGTPNRLVFETNLITGEVDPAKTRRTALGSYKIEKWVKFYQDHARLFPSWYSPKHSLIPFPGQSLEDWTRGNLMPIVDGKPFGLVRGAFGWYTAKIGPNAFSQWTHGTVGRGADQGRFIEITKAELAQFYADPRGFGCTRVENRAIAFLQDLLPVGTRLLKVYARESIKDKELARYQDQKSVTFEFALSKDEVRMANPNSSQRSKQILRAIPEDSVLEVGTYDIDSTPDAVTFKKTAGTENVVTLINPQANLYDLPEKSFQGEFLVDEGRFVNYKHPRELRLGGFKDHTLPAAVTK